MLSASVSLLRTAALAAALAGPGGLALGTGADLPWVTVEAETMETNGALLGPKYAPFQLETEASNQRCVHLAGPGGYVAFAAPVPANTLVVRFSLPDGERGGGTEATLDLAVNGRVVRTLPISSRRAHLYGRYPFSNDPQQGRHRNFYDEVRVRDLAIARGDTVRLQCTRAPSGGCVLDLVDLELVAPPLTEPAGALSVRSFGARGDGGHDDTQALRDGLVAARRQGRVLWLPPGSYVVSGTLEVPSGVTIRGAGMWHTTLRGDERHYGDPSRRVRLRLVGDHLGLADFALVGALDYRNDDEANDGIVGAGCTDATIERVWVEHTKVGAWIYNGARLRIAGCRFRNLLADGVNLCVGAIDCTIENCTARGTGDDCFAIWPAPADQGFVQQGRPGGNVIRHCTGQLPFLANGGALYGGADNRIEDCLFTDITAGCGILVSTTFPTADTERRIDNNFSGVTVVRDCTLVRCGGYDHDWAWRGALQICMDRRRIAGLLVRHVAIRESFSDGVTVVGPGSARGEGTLADCRLEDIIVSGFGLEGGGHHGLWIRADAKGSLVLADPVIPDQRNEAAEFVVQTEPSPR